MTKLMTPCNECLTVLTWTPGRCHCLEVFTFSVQIHREIDLHFFFQFLLDEKGGFLTNAKRRVRKRLFRAVQNGDFSDLEGDIGPASKSFSISMLDPTQHFVIPGRKKDKKVPEHLQDQRDRDRAKKAEYKQARAQARLDAAADPLSKKKGGKKGRKAMLAAAKLDPSISIPERVVDMVTVEHQIRRFLANIGGKSTMALQPMGKESRKRVYELAVAFPPTDKLTAPRVTMDKDGNVKTLPLFGDINVQTPKYTLAIHPACSSLLSLPGLRSW